MYCLGFILASDNAKVFKSYAFCVLAKILILISNTGSHRDLESRGLGCWPKLDRVLDENQDGE